MCLLTLHHPFTIPLPSTLAPQAMKRIHAIVAADGRVVTGVEVFRLLYESVGLGFIYAITK